MKIVETDFNRKTKYEDVKGGQVFLHDSVYFLKTERGGVSVDLMRGTTNHHFASDSNVQIIDCELYIK